LYDQAWEKDKKSKRRKDLLKNTPFTKAYLNIIKKEKNNVI